MTKRRAKGQRERERQREKRTRIKQTIKEMIITNNEFVKIKNPTNQENITS